MIKLLIVEDDAIDIMSFERLFKKDTAIDLETATSVIEAKRKMEKGNFDIIISDYMLRDGNAKEILKIKGNIPFVIVTGVDNQDIALEILSQGAYDFIIKDTKGEYLKTIPVVIRNCIQRNKAELKLKEYQTNLEKLVLERTQEFEAELERHRETEKKLLQAEKDILKAKNSLIFAMATLTESRDNETGAHIIRISEYCRILAMKLKTTEKFKNQIDDIFIEDIYNTSVLHDIGKVGIPDAILLKPGKLTVEEFDVMKTHTEIGGRALAKVYESNPTISYLEMATDIVLHHHEKWNGLGYPRGLEGEDISLAARITTFADIFDALMSRRTYKDAFTKEETLKIMRNENSITLDPNIFPYFEEVFEEFVKVFEEKNDNILDFDLSLYRL